jgi:PAS domain S-box-containing protein
MIRYQRACSGNVTWELSMATILIVDDDADVRKYLATALQETVHRLLEAADGAEGLHYVRTEHPDLVISDLLMPTMSGFEFVRQIRTDPSTARMPVILITGIFQEEEGRRVAEACGVQQLLLKPCGRDELIQAVGKVLSAPSCQTVLAEYVDREHLQLLTNTLIAKVRELEAANRRMEQQVAELKRAEQALQESHALLHAVVEGIPDPVYVKDRESRYLMVNSAGACVAGKPVEELLGQDGAMWMTPETARQVLEVDRRVMESGIGETLEHVGTAAGVSRIFCTTKVPFRGRHSEVLGILGISRDITERKRAEAVAQQLAAIVTSSDDAIISRSLDGIIVSWNRGAERIFGFTAEEVQGHSISHLVVPPTRADEVPRILEELQRGKAFERYETVRKRKDGKLIDVSVTVSPIKDRDGRITGTSAIAQDITEQKKTQEELQRQKERISVQLAELEHIYHYAPVGLCFVDRNLRYVRINEQLAAMNGRPVAEHIGQTKRQIIPELADKVESLLRRTIASGEPILNVEVHGVTPAEPGVERVFLENYVPLKWDDGTVIGVTTAVVEITSRKRSEQQLCEYSERVKALSHRLLTIQEDERAHLARELHDEFGQVLSAFSMNLYNLKRICRPESHPDFDEGIGLVSRAIEHVRQLSYDLRPPALDVLGLETALRGLVEHHREQTNLDVQIVGHLDIFLPPKLGIICFRVVQEALTNVVRHARARQVRVVLKKEDTWLLLVIQDDGIGVDIAAVQRGTAEGKLGLLGMEERVEIVGGWFEIESTPGSGTKISARFPLALEDELDTVE